MCLADKQICKERSETGVDQGEGRRTEKHETEGNHRKELVRTLPHSVNCRHLLETAEANQRRAESKKEKEKNAVNNYGWNVFSEVGV